MNPSTALAVGVTLAADSMCGGTAPNEIVVLCMCCYNDQDPTWEWAVHRAPASAECACCTSEARQREGMLFVVRPR